MAAAAAAAAASAVAPALRIEGLKALTIRAAAAAREIEGSGGLMKVAAMLAAITIQRSKVSIRAPTKGSVQGSEDL